MLLLSRKLKRINLCQWNTRKKESFYWLLTLSTPNIDKILCMKNIALKMVNGFEIKMTMESIMAIYTAWIWIWMTKRPDVDSDGDFSSDLIGRSWYNHFRSFSMGGNGNNPIYPLLSAVLSTWTEPETYFGWNHLVALSKHFRVKKCHFGNFS